MRSNPGDQVINFVMLHLGAHQSPDDERIVEAYHEALEQVTGLAASDQRDCVTLLADLAGHFATTLGQQAGAEAVQQVVDDWAGRGWTVGVDRASTITPTAITVATFPASTGSDEPRRLAGDTAPF